MRNPVIKYHIPTVVFNHNKKLFKIDGVFIAMTQATNLSCVKWLNPPLSVDKSYKKWDYVSIVRGVGTEQPSVEVVRFANTVRRNIILRYASKKA